MLEREETVQTLVDLGLTVLQARVYLALARLGPSTVTKAAKEAVVARQDVYRVLAGLQEKGLVEKIISKPNKYKPIQLKEGLTILLNRRDMQTTEIKNTMTDIFEICERFKGSKETEDHIEKNEFILVSGREAFLNKGKKMLDTAQKSIDFMADFEDSMVGHEILFDLEMAIIKKGVKIREILRITKNEHKSPKYFLDLLKKKPAYEVRFVYCPLPTVIIRDSEELLISTKTDQNIINQPHLASTNPVLSQTFQQFYNLLWARANKECSRIR